MNGENSGKCNENLIGKMLGMVNRFHVKTHEMLQHMAINCN